MQRMTWKGLKERKMERNSEKECWRSPWARQSIKRGLRRFVAQWLIAGTGVIRHLHAISAVTCRLPSPSAHPIPNPKYRLDRQRSISSTPASTTAFAQPLLKSHLLQDGCFAFFAAAGLAQRWNGRGIPSAFGWHQLTCLLVATHLWRVVLRSCNMLSSMQRMWKIPEQVRTNIFVQQSCSS